VFCYQCGERVPDTLRYTITMMLEYLRSYEWIDWWRFEFCVLGALVIDGFLYFFVPDHKVCFRISATVLALGIIIGFIWQWRNRRNL
jgi:hypothetical protein